MEGALQKQRESLEKQRSAVRQQWAGSGAQQAERFFSSLPNAVTFPQIVDCPPLESAQIDELVSMAARKQALDPAILRSVMKQESAFKPCAVSIKGAQGLMQLMPGTARELHVTDVFDPKQNALAGASYLKQMLNRYQGDLRLALVAYNAGPARADQPAGAPYPLETQEYVANILADLGITGRQNDIEPPPVEAEPPDSSGETLPVPGGLRAGSHLKHPDDAPPLTSPGVRKQ